MEEHIACNGLKTPILVVDDKKENLYSFKTILGKAGLKVVTAPSGTEALKYLLSNPVSLVLLDVQMPEMSGFETAQMIRQNKRYQDLPIVFISATQNSDDFVKQGFSVGAYEYLSKPVDNQILINKVKLFRTLYCQQKELEARFLAAEALNDALQSNEILQVTIDQLNQARLAKDEFLASMSHELRTPLSAILGNGELLSKTDLDAEQQDLLHSMTYSGEHLLSLLNDIFDISKIEAGTFEIEPTPYDLIELLDQIEQMFILRAQDAALGFSFESNLQPTHQLWGDSKRIGQILLNLLSNAFKFTEKGDITLKCWEDGEKLYFSVKDTGIGMSNEVVNRLFKPFEQADNSISRRYGGTGLGLYISYSLASMMRGRIDVSSEEGTGTRFVLSLPYQESDLPIDRDKEKQPDFCASFVGNILIVEDIQEMQLFESRLLQTMGDITVTVASDGKEGIEKASKGKFDLILMDLKMPIMDGLEVTRRLREQGNQTPIVALTADVMQQHRDELFRAGADGFLGKPIDKTELRTVLRQYLNAANTDQRGIAQSSEEPVTEGEAVDPNDTDSSAPVLVVDDDHNVLRTYQTIFEKEEEEVDASFNNLLDLVEGGSQKEHGGAEFSLIVANQGAEGVKLARQALEAGRPFFVAFIDMRMPPGIDGLETAKQLRAIDERIFIVIVTAYSDTDHEEIHQQLGYGFFYLKKPFAASEIHQLARTLKQLWQNSTPVSLLAEPEQKTELQQEAPQTDTPNVKQPTKEAHSQVQGRVLVAEDTPEMQLLIKKVVERSGATVSVAENGQEAIEVALQDSFDLILMDMQMPIMDGIEATALLRSMGYDEPIVALTANVMQKDRDRFFEAGCDQYLNKPINMYAINGVLHQYLTESGQVEEREVSVVDDEMRSIFLARLAEIDQELTQLEGTESWEQLRLIAHNMKGSGATFGFPELSKLGREVCDAIDNSQHDSLPRLEGKLIAEISKTLIRSG